MLIQVFCPVYWFNFFCIFIILLTGTAYKKATSMDLSPWRKDLCEKQPKKRKQLCVFFFSMQLKIVLELISARSNTAHCQVSGIAIAFRPWAHAALVTC